MAFGGSGLIRGVISLESDNYVVFTISWSVHVKSGLIRGWPYKRGDFSWEGQLCSIYYLMISTCEIWPDKRVAFGWSGLIRGVTSLERNNYVVFYYLMISTCEIWSDKRGGLWWEWPYKRGDLSWEGQLYSILLSQYMWNLVW